jgi:hypothetical protein
MHENSKLLFAKYGRQFFRSSSRVLEIGPDAFPSTYAKIVGDKTIVWDTVDISNGEKLTYPKANEYSFRVPGNSYDVVVAGQVIEHVREIWIWHKARDAVRRVFPGLLPEYQRIRIERSQGTGFKPECYKKTSY